MKKLIMLLCLPFILVAGCKKEDTAKKNLTDDVSFIFSPNNVSSEITFKNFQTGEVKTYIDQKEEIKFEYSVKPGDRYLMEMKGKTTGLNDGYKIRILYKNKVIDSDRALGDASISDRSLKIDKTFHELDFTN